MASTQKSVRERPSSARVPLMPSVLEAMDTGMLPADATATGGLDHVVRLSNVLQTSLDIEKIIEIFAYELKKIFPYEGLSYSDPSNEVAVLRGTRARHACSYRLEVMGQALGEMVFTRKTKFSAQESRTLEYVLMGLLYPLRNALMYRNAIQAAMRDPLTGVNNRAAFDVAIRREVELAHRHGYAMSLIALDIDYFKRVNDSYGHAVGDSAIRAVAEAIAACTRGTDMVFRYGGEEFMVLLSNTNHEGAMCLAERIRVHVQRTPYTMQNLSVLLTVSQGVACLGADQDARSLFAQADHALYAAKHGGRNCVRFAAATE